MSDQNGLQLLPETRRKIDINVPGENRFLYTGVTILVLVLSLTGSLYFYKNGLESRKNELNAEIINLEKQRDKKAESSLLILNEQLSLISRLLDSHVLWSKGLAKIEGLLQSQVQLLSFSTTVSDSRFEFKAKALNYTALAKQIAAFVSDDSVKDLNLNNVRVLTDGKLEFSVKLDFDKTKFLK